MRTLYLIRLDDACQTMDHAKWARVESILDQYKIRPMVGIIPDNKNPHENICPKDPNFWKKVKTWEDKEWAIALHGYDHCYKSDKGLEGLNPLWLRSEFAGLSLEEQRVKIRKGVALMREQGVNPRYFFAPSHTYDRNTLIALQEESDIRVISDTIGRHPYEENDFIFIPVLGSRCSKRHLSGEWTFCLHPNTMNDAAFDDLESFVSKHYAEFISFSTLLNRPTKRKDIVSCLLSWGYFTYRRLRRIK